MTARLSAVAQGTVAQLYRWFWIGFGLVLD